MNEDKLTEYFLSEKFKNDFSERVKKDTWGVGLPMFYINSNGDMVEHWENGQIRVVKTKEELKRDKKK